MASRHTEGGEIVATTKDGQTRQGTEVTVTTDRPFDVAAVLTPIVNAGYLLDRATGGDVDRTTYVRDAIGTLHEVAEVKSRR